MKIGIDITPLPPNPVGAGTYIIQLVRAICKLPIDHHLFLIAHPNGRKLIGDFDNPNVKWAMIPERSPAARLIWEQFGLPRLAKQMNLNLLHSLHYTLPYFLTCRSVVTFHDMTFFLFPDLHTRSKRLFFPLVIRMSAKRSDAVISVSENTRRDALRILNISPEKIIAIPNGIGGEFHQIQNQTLLETCRAKYKLPADFILFVGLIEPRKNLPMLIKSYAETQKQRIDVPLVIVGREGWHYEKVYQLIKDHGIENKVLFTGYISDQDLPLVYNLARVFVYPSSYEGFGFPPLEAMACGTPVISTAVSAMLETVGNAGILIPPQDGEALSRALVSLLHDQANQERLSQIGLQRAAQFTWERTARETIKVYEKVHR